MVLRDDNRTGGWEPMATAPKGHHDVIDLWCIGLSDDIAFYCADFCAVGRTDRDGNHLYQGRVPAVWWRDGAWRPKSNLRLHALTVTPTHWRWLPDPPDPQETHRVPCKRLVPPTIKMFPGDVVYDPSQPCTCGPDPALKEE